MSEAPQEGSAGTPRVAVVTGAARGIGAGTARRLAADGQQFQIDLIAEGHLDELRARLAWSQASRHLFE